MLFYIILFPYKLLLLYLLLFVLYFLATWIKNTVKPEKLVKSLFYHELYCIEHVLIQMVLRSLSGLLKLSSELLCKCHRHLVFYQLMQERVKADFRG